MLPMESFNVQRLAGGQPEADSNGSSTAQMGAFPQIGSLLKRKNHKTETSSSMRVRHSLYIYLEESLFPLGMQKVRVANCVAS